MCFLAFSFTFPPSEAPMGLKGFTLLRYKIKQKRQKVMEKFRPEAVASFLRPFCRLVTNTFAFCHKSFPERFVARNLLFALPFPTHSAT